MEGYGYDSGLGTCVLCAHGSYKDSIGDTVCTSCSGGGTTAVEGSTAQSACVADVGYYGSAGTFTQCASGTYQPAISQTACVTCPNGVTSSSLPRTAQSDCVCDALGYKLATTGGGAYCDCEAGYERDSSSGNCVPCVADTYCTGDETAAEDCPANSQSPGVSDELTDCVCKVGFTESIEWELVSNTICDDYQDNTAGVSESNCQALCLAKSNCLGY